MKHERTLARVTLGLGLLATTATSDTADQTATATRDSISVQGAAEITVVLSEELNRRLNGVRLEARTASGQWLALGDGAIDDACTREDGCALSAFPEQPSETQQWLTVSHFSRCEPSMPCTAVIFPAQEGTRGSSTSWK